MSSSSFLLPPAFWFRVALQAPFVGRIATESESVELPSRCALPPLGKFEGEAHMPWSLISAGWNEEGLGLVVEVTDKPKAFANSAAELRDTVDICIDTRDTRDVHRATRFCQRFSVKLVREPRSKKLNVVVAQDLIPRALADPPKTDVAKIVRHAAVLDRGWRLGLFFPSACLNGFDPETNRRLGLMVRVSDPHRGFEFLGIADASFPMLDDPSLWATMELTDSD